MADLINLGRARKMRAKAAAEAQAEANRIKFGRSKAQKQVDQIEAARAAKRLNDAQREP